MQFRFNVLRVKHHPASGSVIMQSLIERANNGGHFGIQDKKHYWRYDWHTPTRTDSYATNAANLNAEENSVGDSNLAEKYSFKYKTWLQVEESIFDDELKRNNALDVLDLSIYSVKESSNVKSKTGSNPEIRNTNDDSLTVEDIRGAVGNSESIPGFSSSEPTTKNDNLKIVESQATAKEGVIADIESHTATPASPASPAKSEGKPRISEPHIDQEQKVSINMDKEENSIDPPADASQAEERIQNIEKDGDGDVNME